MSKNAISKYRSISDMLALILLIIYAHDITLTDSLDLYMQCRVCYELTIFRKLNCISASVKFAEYLVAYQRCRFTALMFLVTVSLE